jgi:hypothetical protein
MRTGGRLQPKRRGSRAVRFFGQRSAFVLAGVAWQAGVSASLLCAGSSSALMQAAVCGMLLQAFYASRHAKREV